MARTKHHPRHRPQRRARRDGPRPGTTVPHPPPTARQRPCHAALAANPGSTVAVIADAAGTGKPAARAALLEMEKAGTATRVKGDQARHPRHLDPRRPRARRHRPGRRPGSRAGRPARR